MAVDITNTCCLCRLPPQVAKFLKDKKPFWPVPLTKPVNNPKAKKKSKSSAHTYACSCPSAQRPCLLFLLNTQARCGLEPGYTRMRPRPRLCLRLKERLAPLESELSACPSLRCRQHQHQHDHDHRCAQGRRPAEGGQGSHAHPEPRPEPYPRQAAHRGGKDGAGRREAQAGHR